MPNLKLIALHVSCIAQERRHFPEGKASNTLRGAFGITFRRIAPPALYQRIFEPSATAPGPSGLADWPRPFVFRTTHLDGCTFEKGQRFHFDMNLFITDPSVIPPVVATFSEIVQLESVKQDRLDLPLDPSPDPINRVTVRFLTPTELKSGSELAPRPEFGILACRARDRISTLRALYGEGPLDLDFRSFGERAAAIRMSRCTLQTVDVSRRSSRTGQVHSLGGFVGEAEYEGDLNEFVPYLKAAKWTGVGRQTTWGKGQIEVEEL